MKIGIGDADVPRNEAMRSDVDFVFGHDQRPIEQSEIANGAATVLPDRKRAASVTGNMVADYDRARFCAAQVPENLRALAIKSFAEFHIWRDRLRPPIAFHMPIRLDIAHDGYFA